MKFITVSDLSHGATKIISTLESNREEVVVTKNGKPVVLMRLVSGSDFGSKKIEKRGKEVKKHGKRNLQKG
jgi:prevent-host-death family protein